MGYQGDERGSLGRKWDLHVHTPASYEHEYGDPADPGTWNAYLDAIESLPPEVAALGINDYFSIAGYRRLLAAKAQGRLANIRLLLPVVEIRLEHLAGHTQTQRLNYHVVFSNEIDPDEIEQVFLNGLVTKLGVEDFCLGRESGMAAYGSAIKTAAPAAKRPRGADAKVGFQHAFVKLQQVESILKWSAFERRFLRALGYTEWASVRWDGGGGAVKRTVSERIDFFFGCSASPSDHDAHRLGLDDNRILPKLLDASDAHRLPDATAQDRRLGSSMTWIKADPTFEGLRRAVQRYEERVFVGDAPGQVKRLDTHRSCYIDRIEVRKQPGSSLDEVWFNNDIPLNSGVVAIIGNQGSGKSALTDCLALAANCETPLYSFLDPKRFRREGSRKASQFIATIHWQDGASESRSLDQERAAERPEKARYVPQLFFDAATNEISVERGGTLYTEVEKAVFSHVPNAQRQDCRTFQELVEKRTSNLDTTLTRLRTQLGELNEQIAALEEETSSDRRSSIRARLEERNRQVSILRSAPPAEVAAPSHDSEPAAVLDRLRDELQACSTTVKAAEKAEATAFASEQGLITTREGLLLLKGDAERRRDQLFAELGDSEHAFEADSIMSVRLDLTPLEERIQVAADAVISNKRLQDESIPGTPANRLQEVSQEVDKRTQDLNAAQRAYEVYASDLQRWKDRLEQLESDEDDPDAVSVLTRQLEHVEVAVPERLATRRALRKRLCVQIHATLREKIAVYRDIARHVQAFLEGEPLTRDHYQLQFELELVPTDIPAGLFLRVKHYGPFAGADAAKRWAQSQVDSCQFDDPESVIGLAEAIEARLFEGKSDDALHWGVAKALLRSGTTLAELYNFLYGLSLVEPQYRLALHGKPLDQLSPGERGIMLLIFYLIVDKSDLPLIIDQPEGNLNNQSIYEHVVPVIRAAKRLRQIVMVSHNPNIVVACDADQIIHANLSPTAGNMVTYRSGAIENPEFREMTVDKLEGTRPAFGERAATYER